ncbi:MAG: hypothetical protein WCX65_15450 [bacterium]
MPVGKTRRPSVLPPDVQPRAKRRRKRGFTMNIDPEYKNLIPSLSTEEYAELEKSILTDG